MSKFMPASFPLRSLTLALRQRRLELFEGLSDGESVGTVGRDLEEARVGVDGRGRVAGDLCGAGQLELRVGLLRGAGSRGHELLVGALGLREGADHLRVGLV